MDVLASFWNLVPVTLAQGILYAFVALGVMIPFRLLAFPDLTSEGSLTASGTIFISEPPSNVVALEAATGREIWRYVRRLPEKLPVCCGRVNRGIAILGHRLFLGTLDAKLVALDAHTGAVQWETEVAAPGDGFTITGAPLVVRDAVLIGVSGGEFAIRGFLAAYDAQTAWFNGISGASALPKATRSPVATSTVTIQVRACRVHAPLGTKRSTRSTKGCM